jgi:hypothetical protein
LRIICTDFQQISALLSPQKFEWLLEYGWRHDTSNSVLRNITDDNQSALCAHRCSNVLLPQSTEPCLPYNCRWPLPFGSLNSNNVFVSCDVCPRTEGKHCQHFM